MKTMIRRCLATLSTTILALSVAAQDLGPGARPVGENWSRSPAMAVNGMAATAQPLASSIAVDVLKQGGSAVDAAIAANAALGLMEPTGNGIGDLFAIVGIQNQNNFMAITDRGDRLGRVIGPAKKRNCCDEKKECWPRTT